LHRSPKLGDFGKPIGEGGHACDSRFSEKITVHEDLFVTPLEKIKSPKPET